MFFYSHNDNRGRTYIKSDIGSVKPGAFDHAYWRPVELWAELPQHLTEVLGFKAGRADHSFTLDLHMTNQFC